jgi:hypothetical protein
MPAHYDVAASLAAIDRRMLIMQATIALSLMLSTLTYLSGVFPFLTKFPHLTPGESPLTREITRVPSVSAPRYVGADVLARYAKMTGPRP